jgi:hypothetical protein
MSEDVENRGAICPICNRRNIIYEGEICEHYAGCINVSENKWEMKNSFMISVQLILENEYKQKGNDIEILLCEYETNRLKEICPSASYAIDEEEYAVGPKDFAESIMIFLNETGLNEAKKFITNNK